MNGHLVVVRMDGRSDLPLRLFPREKEAEDYVHHVAPADLEEAVRLTDDDFVPGLFTHLAIVEFVCGRPVAFSIFPIPSTIAGLT
jgi:hypothetical protein